MTVPITVQIHGFNGDPPSVVLALAPVDQPGMAVTLPPEGARAIACQLIGKAALVEEAARVRAATAVAESARREVPAPPKEAPCKPSRLKLVAPKRRGGQ